MAFMKRRSLLSLTTASAATFALGDAAQASTTSGHRRHGHGARYRKPYVVGHRGASGYRPEHTLEAYRLAARMGADIIEPDLVITKDGLLVVRHEPEISGTTDVAKRPEFASRKTTKSLDGKPVTGWFTEDFTLAELRTLRAVERLPELRQRNTIYDGLWQVPTFEEVLKLRRELERELGRTIGVYPETKHSTYFRAQGKPLEEKLVPLIRTYGLDRPGAPIFIQSFELQNLLDLRTRFKVKAPLVFLTDAKGGPFADPKKRSYAHLTSPAGLREWAHLLDGLGPSVKQVIPWNADNTLGAPTSLVRDAHAVGLQVCPWTVRAENDFLPADLRNGSNPGDFGQVVDYLEKLYATGIDGIFSDMPDIAVLARERYLSRR